MLFNLHLILNNILKLINFKVFLNQQSINLKIIYKYFLQIKFLSFVSLRIIFVNKFIINKTVIEI